MKLILVVLCACAMVIEAIPVDPEVDVDQANVPPIITKLLETVHALDAGQRAVVAKRLLSARQDLLGLGVTVDALQKGLSVLGDTVGGLVADVGEGVGGVAKSATGAVSKVVGDLGNGLGVSGLTKPVSAVVDAARSAADETVSKVGAVAGEAVSDLTDVAAPKTANA